MREVIERLEAASEGSRELDCQIAVAVDGYFEMPSRYGWEAPDYGYVDDEGARVEPGHGGDQLVPRYTTSLDASLALAERTIAERGPIDLSICGSAQVVIHNNDPCGNPLATAFGNTPALALCIAILKAHPSKSIRGGE